MQGKDELKTWGMAAFVTVALAIFVFLAQRFVVRFFADIVFEICIFYIPAFASTLFYIYLKRKL